MVFRKDSKGIQVQAKHLTKSESLIIADFLNLNPLWTLHQSMKFNLSIYLI